MNTKENQEAYLKSLKLKNGDKVKINYTKELNQVFEIKFIPQTNEYALENIKTKFIGSITQLLLYDFEKIIETKVGNMKCGDIDCTKCPFYRIECFTPSSLYKKELFDVYNSLKRKFKKPFEQKILDEIILQELNKEVKE